jgi:hypothetical protein
MIVTEHGLLPVCFDGEDLVRIKKMAQDIGDQAIIDFNIHLDNGRTRNVQARPNYILMKLCIEGGIIN